MRQKTIDFKKGGGYLGWVILQKRKNGKKIFIPVSRHELMDLGE